MTEHTNQVLICISFMYTSPSHAPLAGTVSADSVGFINSCQLLVHIAAVLSSILHEGDARKLANSICRILHVGTLAG